MNQMCDQVFSHAALPANEYRGKSRRDALRQCQYLLHFRAACDDVGVVVLPSQRLSQAAVFLPQASNVQFLLHH